MQILMFGWEFPPMNSGGLGVACQGIVEGLSHHGHEVYLVLPKVSAEMHAGKPDKLNLLSAHKSGGHIESIEIPSSLYSPYVNSESYAKWI
ncbi:glycogen/starch synthase, partial [Patescibacteria group bacterium]|nr:glycogen/starch synthase [Patescibacteria group bacterium]